MERCCRKPERCVVPTDEVMYRGLELRCGQSSSSSTRLPAPPSSSSTPQSQSHATRDFAKWFWPANNFALAL